MAVVGFNLHKIEVLRNSDFKGKFSITTGMKVVDVKPYELFLGENKQEGLRLIFKFSVEYKEGFGNVGLEGEVIVVDNAESIKKARNMWDKSKKIPSDTLKAVLPTILNKCNIEALVLARDVNLPPPFPIPKVQIKKV